MGANDEAPCDRMQESLPLPPIPIRDPPSIQARHDSPPLTDFELCGYVASHLHYPWRHILLTVDLETIQIPFLPIWVETMHLWAEQSERMGLRFNIFLSIEDAVRVRGQPHRQRVEFGRALRALTLSGSRIYAHNHGVFGPAPPRASRDASEIPPMPFGYTKRESFFHNVVHKHGLLLPEWLGHVHREWGRVLADADCVPSRIPAFRAGGWDYGSTCRDLGTYIESLRAAGFLVDSSACRGVFGTRSWRVGAGIGANLFRLKYGVTEVAPCLSLDSSRPSFSRPGIAPLLPLVKHVLRRRSPLGVLVVVLHFDHLFHMRVGPDVRTFAITDSMILRRRIGSLFRRISFLGASLRAKPITFDDLEFPTCSSPSL